MLSDVSCELVIEPELCPLHAAVEARGGPMAKWLRRGVCDSAEKVPVGKADRPHRHVGAIHLPSVSPGRYRPAAIRHGGSVAGVMFPRTAELVAEPLADADCHGVSD